MTAQRSLGRALATVACVEAASGTARAVAPVVLGRALGTTGFGAYGIAASAASLVFNVGCFGLPLAATYHVATARSRALVWRLLRWSVAAGVVAASVALVPVAAYLRSAGVPDATVLAILTAVVGGLYVVENVGLGVLRGQHRNVGASAWGLVRQAALLAIAGLALMLHWSVASVMGALAVLTFFLAVALGVMSLRGKSEHLGYDRTDVPSAGAVVGFGIRGQAATLVTLLNYRVDVLLLGALASVGDAGRYAAAVAIAEIAWFPSFVAATGGMSRLAADPSATDRAALAERLCRITSGLTLIAAVVVALVSPWILEYGFGPGFSTAYPALLLTLVGVIALAPSRVLATDQAAAGKPGANFAGSVLGLLVNVVLNLFLIPRYGIEGAGAATAVSYSVVLIDRIRCRRQLPAARSGLTTLLVPKWGDLQAIRRSLKFQ